MRLATRVIPLLTILLVICACRDATITAAAAIHTNVSAKRPPARTDIIGGTPASGSAFASLAFVEDVRGDKVGECTGTVVGPDAVLTAGHCAENLVTGIPNAAAGYSVTTNSLNLASQEAQHSTVSQVIVDPAFRPIRGTSDAALLILTTPTAAPPITLATRNSTMAGTGGILAGWGLTSFHTQAWSPRLYIAPTIVQSDTWCVRHTSKFVRNSEMCALHPPGVRAGTCKGDSGGPLLVLTATGPVEIALVSRGSTNCSTNHATVLTGIPAISPWLDASLASLSIDHAAA